MSTIADIVCMYNTVVYINFFIPKPRREVELLREGDQRKEHILRSNAG